MILRRVLRTVFYSSIALSVIGIFCFLVIEDFSAKYLYDEVNKIPKCKAGLVLGTSRQFLSGRQNYYFKYRIDAAEKLFKSGRVSVLILSGDNRVNDYNEPQAMREELLKCGVPDSCLVMDYAGLRTFDSMVRCKDIFGQDTVIVVSQQFHTTRAVFIGRKKGMTAFGFNAQSVSKSYSFSTRFREFFSRMKCVLDVYILPTKPKHLGDKIKVN